MATTALLAFLDVTLCWVVTAFPRRDDESAIALRDTFARAGGVSGGRYGDSTKARGPSRALAIATRATATHSTSGCFAD
ncbi:hypothetical protein D3C72_2111660 [compost metagenome]